MKKSIIFFAALAALFSCAKENPVVTPAEETFSVEIFASAPAGDDEVNVDTKTTLVDGEGKKFVHWSKGDAIKVLFFPNHTINASFSGSNGVFTSHFDEDASASAYFRCDSWLWGSTVSQNGVSYSLNEKGIALYPATATAKSTKPSGNTVICDTEVSFVLPSTQTAVKDNIESNLNFSYATVDLSQFQNTISNGAQTDLKFNNVCAMIELTMPSAFDKKVTSISIESNNNVPLTGKGVATMSYYKNEIDSDPYSGVSDHIFKAEISNGAGVTLNNANGFEAGAKYYAVVWPGKHDSGLTIEFVAEDGTKATKTTGKVELTASRVKPYTFNKGLAFASEEYDYVYDDGSFGNDPNPSGKSVVGVIFFNGDPRENDPELPTYCTNGLAISLAPTSTKWIGSKKFPNTNFQSHGLNSTSGSVWGYTAMCKWKDLYSTDYLQIYKTDYGTLPAGKTSGWYHGTNCEWDMISKSVGKINEKLKACGKTELSVSSNSPYWVALGYTATYMYMVKAFTSTGATYGYLSGIGSANYARPIFAF